MEDYAASTSCRPMWKLLETVRKMMMMIIIIGDGDGDGEEEKEEDTNTPNPCIVFVV
jgi:predicted metal-dependent peptidase